MSVMMRCDCSPDNPLEKCIYCRTAFGHILTHDLEPYFNIEDEGERNEASKEVGGIICGYMLAMRNHNLKITNIAFHINYEGTAENVRNFVEQSKIGAKE